MSNAMKLGKETGSLTNAMMSHTGTFPVVGKGATLLSWTDRYAYFVNSVSADGKTCVIERAIAIREDNNGMSDAQSYRYERHAPGDTTPVTLRFRYGRWYLQHGTPLTGISYSKINVCFGTMREYYDHSF